MPSAQHAHSENHSVLTLENYLAWLRRVPPYGYAPVLEQLHLLRDEVVKAMRKAVHLRRRGGHYLCAVAGVDPDSEVVTDLIREVKRDTPGQEEAPVLHGVDQLVLSCRVQGVPERLFQCSVCRGVSCPVLVARWRRRALVELAIVDLVSIGLRS